MAISTTSTKALSNVGLKAQSVRDSGAYVSFACTPYTPFHRYSYNSCEQSFKFSILLDSSVKWGAPSVTKRWRMAQFFPVDPKQ